MWISKKRIEAMERKIAALEEEQLRTNRLILDTNRLLVDTNNSNEEVIKIVKQLRKELGLIEIKER